MRLRDRNEIDVMNENLPELRNFILPDGVPKAAAIHIARTVARRANAWWLLHEHNATTKEIIKYLNRLSDFCSSLRVSSITPITNLTKFGKND